MRSKMTKQQLKKLIGKPVYAVRKDGKMITGRLVEVKGEHIKIKPNHKKVTTKAVLPLVLYDLLAIGAYGGYGGYPYGGYPYGGYGGGLGYPGYGYPGYFW